jgi:hypothetical protein
LEHLTRTANKVFLEQPLGIPESEIPSCAGPGFVQDPLRAIFGPVKRVDNAVKETVRIGFRVVDKPAFLDATFF